MSARIGLIIAALMISTARAQLNPPSGASIAFTSDDPALMEIRNVIASRGFPSKEQLAKLDQKSTDPQIRQARAEMKEILRPADPANPAFRSAKDILHGVERIQLKLDRLSR